MASQLSSAGDVGERVRRRIQDLEQAIQRVDFVRRHLNHNSSQIKSQIHACISSHLEVLREREVQLLAEVGEVVGGREDTLQQQQARLHKALGVLHSALTHAGHSDDANAQRHLSFALEALTSMQLDAEATPYLAFRGDQGSLRAGIAGLGRLDASGLPFLAAMVDGDDRAAPASLPRHLEEYDDSQHHVFYKTLSNTDSTAIQVSLPRLSPRVEDWLQRPVLHLSASLPDMTQVDAPPAPPALTPTEDGSRRPSCSIQQWLAQIKQNPDLEDEHDYEIVDSRESPMEESKPLVASKVQAEADPRWLQAGSTAQPQPREHSHAFFRHIPTDTQTWLSTARRQLESLETLKGGCDWFKHIPTDTASWLRRPHNHRAPSQATQPDPFAHIPRNTAAWLAHGQKTSAEMSQSSATQQPPAPAVTASKRPSPSAAPVDTWLMPKTSAKPTPAPAEHSVLPGLQRYLKDTCTSAWLAVSPENAFPVPSPSPSLSLSATLAPTPSFSATLKPTPSLSLSATLTPSTSTPTNSHTLTSTDTTGFFSHISRNASDWLKPAKIARMSSPRDDNRRWLSREEEPTPVTPASAPTSLPMESLRKAMSHLTTSDWLAKGKGGDNGREEGRKVAEENLERKAVDAESLGSDRSWSIVCSSESSVSSHSCVSLPAGVNTPLPGTQQPALPSDLATWVYQKCL